MLLWTRREIMLFLLFSGIFVVLYHVFNWRWLHLPWTPISLVGIAVAFIVGFQNNIAYGRMWEARKIWGGITNSSRVWAIMTGDMLTNEHATVLLSSEELAQHKQVLVYRHIAWITALRYEMRSLREWEQFNEHVTNREWSNKVCIPENRYTLEEELQKLLSEKDLEYTLSKPNKCTALIYLQSKHLRVLKEQGIIWEFSFLEFKGLLRDLLTLQGKSERIKNFPYPRQYATLNNMFVRLFIFLLPFGLVPEFASIGESMAQDLPVIGELFVWLAVPFVTTVSWVFHTMERIGIVGENPFEGSANDVPISTISRNIEIELRHLLNEDVSNIPEPIPSLEGVQM